MNQYKKFLGRTDLVKNQVEREKLAEQEAASKRKRRIQEANRRSHLRYQEQLRSELAARYFHSVMSTGGESFSNTKSLNFDGVDDYIDCGDNDNLSFTNNVNDSAFTFSLWAKVDTLSVGHALIEKGNFATSNNREYIFSIGSDGAIYSTIYAQGQSLNRRGRKTSTGLISINTWYHIAWTYNGQGGTNASNGIKIYLDGVRVDNANNQKNSYTAMTNTSNPLKIGEFINGNLDEVSVFNSELSQSDITAIFGTGVPTSLTSLSPLSWWRFEEGSGTTAIDSGTGGNNGTLEGPPTYSTDVPE